MTFTGVCATCLSPMWGSWTWSPFDGYRFSPQAHACITTTRMIVQDECGREVHVCGVGD